MGFEIKMKDCVIIGSKLKQSPLGELMCTPKAKFLTNNMVDQYLTNKLISEFVDRQHYRTFKNRWNNFMEMDYSFYFACSGIEARQP